MMGRQDRDQGQLFYEFNLDEVIPKEHLLRRMNVFVTGVLADLHQQLRLVPEHRGLQPLAPDGSRISGAIDIMARWYDTGRRRVRRRRHVSQGRV